MTISAPKKAEVGKALNTVRGSVRTSVRAWDLPTCLFKWSLVLLVFMAWASDKFGGANPDWHKWNGYAILVLILFRVFRGFAGGSTARFSAAALASRKLHASPYLDFASRAFKLALVDSVAT